jgi:aspartate aminotransferase-like enzyme
MGYSAQQRNVMLLLTALQHVLRRHGFDPPASGAAAADAVYNA